MAGASPQEAPPPAPADRGAGLPAGATVLDVPYLPQSELLCGGAAAAMVLRYWGMAGVRAEDFSHLVGEARGGMTAEDLAADIRELGWEVFPFSGRYEEVRRHLRLGRPVISLLEVAPRRFHYVVLVGQAADRLVLHDPAATPFRLVGRDELEEIWRATGGLSLLVLPPPGRDNVLPLPGRQNPGRLAPPENLEPPCRAAYERGVSAGAAGRLSEAAARLSLPACGTEAAFQRELAGVLLRQGRAPEAIPLARRALAARPKDEHAARTLATALYVAGHPAEALEAWNRTGEPIVDLIRIAAPDGIDYAPAGRMLGLEGGGLLTPAALALARRRLADLPAAALTRVDFAPTGGGRADVFAGIAEREGLPTSAAPLAAFALRAGLYREISLTAVSPLGRGETWTGTWRWWHERPAVSFGFAAPAEVGPPAVWRLDTGWERETYDFTASGTQVESAGSHDERTSVMVGGSTWVLPTVRTAVRVGFDRWTGSGDHGRLGATLEARVAGDLLRLVAEGDAHVSVDDRENFTGGRVAAFFRSATARDGFVGAGRVYLRAVGSSAPRTLWPGAGVGIARPELLRAHPLLDGGVVRGPALDRRLVGGGLELTRWFALEPGLRIGGAGFMDAARTRGSRRDTTLVDVGLGLRLSTAAGGPTLRLDVATGLSDDEWAVSAGWSAGD